MKGALDRGTRQPWLFASVLLALAVALAAGLFARGQYMQPAPVLVQEPAPVISAPASAMPGPAIVAMSADASSHPDGAAVQRALQTYFDSINKGDYTAWLGVVTEERAKDKPRAQWKREFSSTRDGSVFVLRIERAGSDELRVMLTFNSLQSLEDAPPDFQHKCIRWRVVFPLAIEDGQWKLEAGHTAASPQHDVC